MCEIIDFNEIPDLLTEHLPLLLASRKKVLAEPRMAHAELHSWLRTGRDGGPDVTIGGLLHAWGEGHLLRPCNCGGIVHVCRFDIMPGRSESSWGQCPQCGRTEVYVRRRLDPKSVRFLKNGVAAVQKYAELPRDRFPFKQVLNRLLGRPAEAYACDPNRSPVLVYDYLSAELTDRAKGHVICRWRRGRCELPDGNSADSAGEGVFTWPDGTPRLLWRWNSEDPAPPGLPRSGRALVTRGRADSEQAVLSLDDLVLHARNVGPVLHLTDRVPQEMLAVWAWREGLLDTAFEKEVDGCPEGK